MNWTRNNGFGEAIEPEGKFWFSLPLDSRSGKFEAYFDHCKDNKLISRSTLGRARTEEAIKKLCEKWLVQYRKESQKGYR